jgi:HEPN domain-containing protein
MDNTSVESWVRLAEQDYASARHLMGLYPRPVEVVCYLCQQAAEKILKAILVADNLPIPRTHDLVALTQSMMGAHPALQELLPLCARLSVFAVTTRYPYPGELPENADSAALEGSGHILELAKDVLQQRMSSR